MKKIFLPFVILLVLASCSGTAATAPTSDIYVSQNLPADYEGALAVRNQLALGTLELNQADMQDWATSNGITLGSGGGTPGQGSGMSPEARATKQAAEGVTSSESGSGSKLASALIGRCHCLIANTNSLIS